MNTHEVIPVIIFAFFIFFVLLLRQVIGRYILVYKLKEKGIFISYFGIIPITFIKYQNIEAITTTSFGGSFSSIFAASIVNRISSEPVIIRQKRSFLFRTVIISPDNPEEFVATVQEKIDTYSR